MAGAHWQGIDIVDAGITAAFSGQFEGTSFRDAQQSWIYAADVGFLKTLRLRAGRLNGEGRIALNRFAVDINLFRHLEFGLALMTARYAFYDGQKSFHMAFYNMLDWGRKDATWWRD